MLGARFRFDSDDRQILRLVDAAYAGLPEHRLSSRAPQLRVRLVVTGGAGRGRRREPAPLAMLSAPGLLGGAQDAANLVMVSPGDKSALVAVSRQMLTFRYHTRYEFIEFAVFTLAARAQGLVPLHAACVGAGGRGLLLIGPSGAGKSTVALQCLLQGLDFLSEDSVFVAPESLLATGVANYLHLRADSLRWAERPRDATAIRRSPVIQRRSGVRKFECDLRRSGYRLAASPLEISAIVFLSRQAAVRGPLLRPVAPARLRSTLAASQPYAARRPEWPRFTLRMAGLPAFELRRGQHPREAAEALRALVR